MCVPSQIYTNLILGGRCAWCTRSCTVFAGRNTGALDQNELATLIDRRNTIIRIGIQNLRMAAGAAGRLMDHLTFMAIFVGQNSHRCRHALVGGEYLTHEDRWWLTLYKTLSRECDSGRSVRGLSINWTDWRIKCDGSLVSHLIVGTLTL